MRFKITLVIVAALSASAFASGPGPDPTGTISYGEKLDPSMYGPGIVETMAEAMARVDAQEAAAFADPKGRNGQQGTWSIPSKGATYFPHSGEHNLVNKWGDTSMGIAFPAPVNVHGAYLAGQGGQGVWTSGVRVIGYRHGQEVASTEWFREIGSVPAWFEMELEGIDRVVIESEPRINGGGWYALDDLTFTRLAGPGQSQPATVVLDFEDTTFTQKLTGAGYAGLVWETGTGDFSRNQQVVPAPHEVPGQLMGPPAEPTPGGGMRGLGTTPELGWDYQGVIRGDAGSWSAPPDTCGAVGPNHFVETVNRMFAVYDKFSGANLIMTGLGTLLPGGSGDPRVLYDQHSGRWIAMDTDFSSDLFLAVSLTDDPTGSWFKTSYTASTGGDAGFWPDYPTLGVDADGIYISAYMVGRALTIWAIDKAPLIDASPSLGTVTAWRNLNGGTQQPVHTFGDAGGEYIISTWASSTLYLRFIEGPLTAPTLSHLGQIDVDSYSFPPDVPSIGVEVPLDSVDQRLMNAVYRDGSIWTTHSVLGGAGTCCAWYEIDAVAQTVTQSGRVTDPVMYYWMPSIMVNVRGDAIMGFSGCNENVWAGCYYTGRLADDPPGEMATPELLRMGQAPHSIIDSYGRNRWGDYSLCSLDPDDELSMWTIQEYAHDTNVPPFNTDVWGTHIARLGYLFDCNNNTVDDYHDVSMGTSPDADTDGIPDECQVTRLYVDPSATGANAGVTWADAYTSLGNALTTAAGSGIAEEIWVVAGTYTPDQPGGDRQKSLNLVSGVKVYGGFDGAETSLGERDPATNVTILSGDLNGDDGSTGNAENSYHVVVAQDVDSNGLLDGVRIRGGNADGGFPESAGGGIYIDGGGPRIVDCIFEDNEATSGGALYAGSTSAEVVGCTFQDNAAPVSGGGAAYVLTASPTFIDCKFLGNTTGGSGGAAFILGSSAGTTMANCLLSGNQADLKGGGVHDVATGLITLVNCSLSANTAGTDGGGLHTNGNTAVTSSVVWGNSDSGGGDESGQIHVSSGSALVNYSCVEGLTGGLGGTDNTRDDPLLNDPNGADETYGTADDDVHLQPGSPCIDVGDNTAVPAGVTTDLDGNPRFIDDPASIDGGNGTPPIVDMGAYEAPASSGAVILAAVSLLDHGGTEMGLNLMANNIEPRQDGVLKIEFGVSAPASSVGAAVSCLNNTYTGSAVATAVGTTVTVDFSPALPNADCCEIILTGDVEDSFAVRTLKGDVDQSGTTSTYDALIAKLFFGESAAVAGATFDYNTSGTVTTADYLQIKISFGASAPSCP